MLSRRKILVAGGIAAAAAGAGYVLMSGRSDYETVASAVWSPRDPSSFQGLIHYASLAANSHNAQPWRFRETRDGVAILPDPTRALPVADPDDHHLFASLGCAAENLILAAGAAGRSADLAFVEEGERRVEVSLGAGGARDPLFDTILSRQCTRSDYDGRPVPPAELAALVRAAERPGVQILLIEDRAQIEQVLELILAANTLQVSDPAFAAELRSWLRFNGRAAAETGDGLYAAASGNPTLPTALGGVMFRLAFSPGRENDRYARQVRSSSGLVVIVSDRDDRRHWVEAGRVCQRFALQATALGIRHAHLNQAVEVASVRRELQALLGLGERRPDLILRFGYGDAMPRSLRRPIAEVIDL